MIWGKKIALSGLLLIKLLLPDEALEHTSLGSCYLFEAAAVPL